MSEQQIITNLTKKEFLIYRTLAEYGEATVSELSNRSHLQRTTIYNFIDKLASKGLIEKKIANNHAVYFPCRDDNVKILQSETLSHDLDNFRIFRGKRSIKKAILETLDNKRVDWLVDSATTTDLLGNRFFEKYVETGHHQQVKIRVLRSSVSHATHRYHSEEAILNIGRIVRRSQSTIPYHGSFALFDAKVLLLSNQSDGLAYLISDPIIHQTLHSIFQGLWKYSKVLGE